MEDTHEHLEEHLKSIILSGPLRSIHFYQINDSYFYLPREGYCIIDAGIELRFPAGVISAAWSVDLESYVIENKELKTIYSQDNYFEISNTIIDDLKKNIGLEVKDVRFKSLEYEYIVDYTMRTEKEKRFVELILEFQNHSTLQIAFVTYVLEKEMQPKDFTFDITTELLVSLNKMISLSVI